MPKTVTPSKQFTLEVRLDFLVVTQHDWVNDNEFYQKTKDTQDTLIIIYSSR